MIALLGALALSAAPAPLSCPAGTERRGGTPPDAYEEWCEGKDDAGRPRREGPARTFYDDGGPWTEERFHEARPSGPFVERHRNGKKAREGAFADGRKVGRWTLWYESGALEEESDWRDGVAEGEFRAYWPNGRKRTEGHRCGGAQCGTWRSWDDAGREIGSVEYGEQSRTP